MRFLHLDSQCNFQAKILKYMKLWDKYTPEWVKNSWQHLIIN
jgi:hypothetical protein